MPATHQPYCSGELFHLHWCQRTVAVQVKLVERLGARRELRWCQTQAARYVYT
jgi:hypothetical protein